MFLVLKTNYIISILLLCREGVCVGTATARVATRQARRLHNGLAMPHEPYQHSVRLLQSQFPCRTHMCLYVRAYACPVPMVRPNRLLHAFVGLGGVASSRKSFTYTIEYVIINSIKEYLDIYASHV